ncbi:MAG TPA: AAA family ATPase [Chitinispirillaceae bacterium]|nr:AAA family ATPase [Chitinispirillaceae bacterium]
MLRDEYEVIDTITENAEFALLSVVQKASNIEFLMKLYKYNESESKLSIEKKFTKETDLFNTLEHYRIARPLQQNSLKNGCYLLFPYERLFTLQNYIEKKEIVGLVDSIKISIQILDVLELLHRRDVVYCNIHPERIFISEEKGIFIYDFGQSLTDLDWISSEENESVNTYPYFSPEQTGFTGFKPDHRSDLYCLGLLLYRLISGAIPFSPNPQSVGELIDLMLKSELEPLQSVPSFLNEVLIKALRASPGDRYQTAAGFRNDLHLVLSLINSEISDLKCRPGELDSTLIFKKNHPFVTRDIEIDALNQAAKEVLGGKQHTILLFGNSGAGKTEIVRNFVKNTDLKDFVFLAVKCNRFTPNQPYSVYKEIIVKCFSRFEHYNKEFRTELNTIIRTRLSEYATGICRVLPELDAVFEDTQATEYTENEKESERVNWALFSLLEIICRQCRMFIVVDDLQWVDFTSFQIFSNLKVQNVPYLCVCTYRVDNSELKYGIHGMNFEQFADRVIQVKPFTKDEVKWYLESLFGDPAGIDELADVLYKQTNGNPFNIQEYTYFLVENKYLEKTVQGWCFKQELRNTLPERYDTFSLIVAKIESLESIEKTILQTSSLFDGIIEKEILVSVIGCTMEGLIAALKKLEANGFLNANINDEFNFVHDKVQETIYSSIEITKRKLLYEKFGNEYEKRVSAEKEYCFNAAEAYLKSSNLNKAVQLSYQAGHHALHKAALNLASRHFRNCLILTEQMMRFEGMPDISVVDIELSLANTLMLSGKNEQALKLFSKIKEQKTKISEIDRLELEYKIGCIQINIGEFAKAREHFYKVLFDIGLKIPVSRFSVFISLIQFIFIKVFSPIIPKRKTGAALQMNILKIKILNKLTYTLISNDFFPGLAPHLKALILSERISDCKEKAETCSMHVVLALQLFLKKRAMRYLEKIAQIGKKIQTSEIRALLTFYSGYFNYYCGNWNNAQKFLESSTTEYSLLGDIPGQIGCMDFIWKIAFMRGDFKTVLQKLANVIELCNKTREKNLLYVTKAAQALIMYITDGKAITRKDVFNGGRYEALLPYNAKVNLATLHAQYSLCNGNFGDVYSLTETVLPSIEKQNLNSECHIAVLSCKCEAVIKDMAQGKSGGRQITVTSGKLILRFFRDLIKLFFLSRNYPAYKGVFYRIVAWYFVHLKIKNRALKNFQKAINEFHKLDMKCEEARTQKDMAIIYDSFNIPGFASDCFSKAYKLFEQCGAEMEMERIEEKINPEISKKRKNSKKAKAASIVENVNQIRFDTLLDVSNSIYELGDIAVLLHQILSALIKATGAQYGYIFVVENEEAMCRLALDFRGDEMNDYNTDYEKSIVIKALQEKQIVLENFDPESSITRFEKARSVLCVPLYHKNENRGCVYLANDNVSGLFSDNASKTAQILSAQASILLENAYLMEKYKSLNRELDLKVKKQTKDIIDKNRQLEDTNVKLIESERLKGILSGTLVHDIKNYAAGIEGNLQYLSRRITGDNKVKRVIDVVNETCMDIINLASNLLDIAKMDEGRLLVRPENIEYNYLDGLLCKFASNPLFEDKGIKPVIKRPETQFSIDADTYLIERVVQNIFSNAAKYVPAGGHVEVSFENGENEHIICFFNSGTPIPERDKEILFEKYARIENRQTQYSKGLGLFFCKMVMIAHKGRVWVDSDETGNYFKLAFPVPVLAAVTESALSSE